MAVQQNLSDPRPHSVSDSMRRLPLRLLSCCALSAVLLLSACSSSQPAAPAEKTDLSAKISYFYPGQEAVPPGDSAQVCYGVEHATTLRLEPPVAEVRPLSNKCVWFEPKQTMDLTLIATGSDGKEVSSTVQVNVRAGAPSRTRDAVPSASSGAASTGLIETFVATSTQISPGGASTICYVLGKEATLTMSPSQGDLGRDLKKCVLVKPTSTTTYTLTANAGGVTDKASVTVKVQ